METLLYAEKAFGLDDVWRFNLFRERIGPVIGRSLGSETAVYEKIEPVATVTVAEDALTWRKFEKSELGVGLAFSQLR